MYMDTVVIASLLVVAGAIAVGVGFFVYIWMDNADNPGDTDTKTPQD